MRIYDPPKSRALRNKAVIEAISDAEIDSWCLCGAVLRCWNVVREAWNRTPTTNLIDFFWTWKDAPPESMRKHRARRRGRKKARRLRLDRVITHWRNGWTG